MLQIQKTQNLFNWAKFQYMFLIFSLFNWDSPYARLNSHYKAWNYKKKKHKKNEAYTKSV